MIDKLFEKYSEHLYEKSIVKNSHYHKRNFYIYFTIAIIAIISTFITDKDFSNIGILCLGLSMYSSLSYSITK